MNIPSIQRCVGALKVLSLNIKNVSNGFEVIATLAVSLV